MLHPEVQEFLAGKGSFLIVGLGITGIESALFLKRCGVDVRCVERTPRDEFLQKSKFAPRLTELDAAGIEYQLGVDGEGVAQFLKDVRVAVLSPGVSLESSIVGALKRHGVKTLSEIELGIELARVPVIMVTGSNGKSTTVSLISHILQSSGIPNLLCGNVGVPIVSMLTRDDVISGAGNRYRYLVVEASSYQLESCERIKPKVAVFLNLSDNHLERHGSMQRYLEAKTRMFANQDKNDFAVLNGDDSQVSSIAARLGATVGLFGCKNHDYSARIDYEPKKGIDQICLSGEDDQVIEPSTTKLLGLHNRYDMAAAALAVYHLGVSLNDIQAALNTFVPLEHRLELIGDYQGRTVINDSKSTTVAASLSAVQAILETYTERSVVVMLGGLAKAGSWEPLLKVISKQRPRIRALVCFGKDGRVIARHAENFGIEGVLAPTLSQGFQSALALSQKGDVVLLSPGCASFDEFRDFEHRGEIFKKLVSDPKSIGGEMASNSY